MHRRFRMVPVNLFYYKPLHMFSGTSFRETLVFEMHTRHPAVGQPNVGLFGNLNTYQCTISRELFEKGSPVQQQLYTGLQVIKSEKEKKCAITLPWCPPSTLKPFNFCSLTNLQKLNLRLFLLGGVACMTFFI